MQTAFSKALPVSRISSSAAGISLAIAALICFAALDTTTAAMADFLGSCDGAAGDGSALHYPPPERAHPVGTQAQIGKIRQAQADAGTVPVIAFAHSYGPRDDVQARTQTALNANTGSGRLWVNRYGYLSDDKLEDLASLMAKAQARP